eukprot:TRINITY_DN2925_c1_g2_i1.p1 TRINITY_DN2925_c1_g2~~TRINITY_DN2925_c1_g2_i1.p1  ORF type:complete len:668 (-),score=95.90 TRINITY_DN2925_c1_g2_i1:78-2081(-)
MASLCAHMFLLIFGITMLQTASVETAVSHTGKFGSLEIDARAAVGIDRVEEGVDHQPNNSEVDDHRHSEGWQPTKGSSLMRDALQRLNASVLAAFSDGGAMTFYRFAEQAPRHKPLTRREDRKHKQEHPWYSENEDNILWGLFALVCVEYLVFYCFCMGPKAVEQPPVEIPPIDESLNKEAAYLKRTEQFPKPLSSKIHAGCCLWTIVLLVWLLPLPCALNFSGGKWHFSVGPFLVVNSVLHLLLVLYGTYRWRLYFLKLPKTQKECPILSHDLPLGTLEPTPMSMRPLYMSWLSYMWCMHVIYVPFMVKAGYTLLIRGPRAFKKVRSGAASPNLTVGQAFGKFMLETSAFMWFKKIEETNGVLLGYFSSQHLGPIRTLLVKEGTHDMQNIEIWVDLKERTVVRASIDGLDFMLCKVFFLIAFIFTGQSHAWLHSVCTWALAPEADDYFIRKMSVCTMFFNHLGFDFGLPQASAQSGREEFLTGGNPRSDQFEDELPYLDEIMLLGPFQAAPQNFFTPELAGKLVPYSRFCAFAYLLYKPFMALFEAEAVKICDSAEACFYHTVLHCTDHWSFSQMFNLSPNDLANLVVAIEEAKNAGYAENEPKIDYVALEPGLCTTLGLTDDFVKSFNVYHRDSPSNIRLFRKIYEIAKPLDPELAYHLQCCIIK